MNDNVLCDGLISVQTRDGTQKLSLPGALAALLRDEVLDFPALRPHQRHPWHAFLCQLAVMAAEAAGLAELPQDMGEGRWRDLLRGLTPGFPKDEPWRLVVPDLSRPAFLQPPVPEGSLAGFTGADKADKSSPFSLDVLVTSKEHGEKDRDGCAATLEDWLIGLVMLQTFSGFLGQGNYGAARQNGGFAARPGVSLVFSPRPGPRFARDCRVLLSGLDGLRTPGVYPQADGKGLLWIEPWGGSKDEALPLQKLHPLFIEVCRRVRLVGEQEEAVRFAAKGTKAARVAATDYNGAVGDPWIPVSTEGGEQKAWNSAPHYSKIYPILFERSRFAPALLQQFHPSDPMGDAVALFRVFKRKQGGSDGYFERLVTIPAPCRRFCAQDVNTAAKVAQEMEAMAHAARVKCLRPALVLLMQGAKDSPDFQQPETAQWATCLAEGFDRCVDSEFFPMLWRCLDALAQKEDAQADLTDWREFLIQEARAAFEAAVKAAPLASSLRWRAVARADLKLETCLKKHLPAPPKAAQDKEVAQ